MGEPEKQGTADCYTDSFRCLLDRASPFMAANALLCHGYPVLRGGPHAGHRYGHAWVEWLDVFAFDAVIRVVTTIEQFYRVGQIETQHVRRYTVEEARAMLDEHGHLGPWAPDPYPGVLYVDPTTGAVVEGSTTETPRPSRRADRSRSAPERETTL